MRRTAGNGACAAGGVWGLSLFLRRGMAAWMLAWPQQADDNPPVQTHLTSAVALASLSESLTGQLVTVLANMVFTARQEVFA